MFSPDEYSLLDFGDGRRLERFGPLLLDRPCPAVEEMPRGDSRNWAKADARFGRRGSSDEQWSETDGLPDRWNIAHEEVRFELKRTGFGHLGIFPEQSVNWDWIARRIGAAGTTLSARSETTPATSTQFGRGVTKYAPENREVIPGQVLKNRQTITDGFSLRKHEGRRETRPVNPTVVSEPILKVLNLFAYTGGCTLAAAAAGAEVVHVDAARNTVNWARRNAEISGLADAPIRWIVDDAAKFVRREVKRGNRYDAVILDPPSYGHGARGEVWQLSKHLEPLLADCAKLTAGRCRFLLLTCHTPGHGPPQLKDLLADAMGDSLPGKVTAGPLTIRAADGRAMPSGVFARWAAT